MFGWLTREKNEQWRKNAATLYEAVRTALSDEDDVHIRIVASTAALLLCVAYADRDYDASEEGVVRQTLSGVRGLDDEGITAIVGVLREHTVAIASAEASSYARELLELTEDDFRHQILDVLVDLAAADGTIRVSETNMLRTIARSLGLPQSAYNASQARHRDKLAVLDD